MPRLAEVLLDAEGAAEFEFLFGRDQNRRVVITGFVRSSLGLECQRCLERLELPVDARVRLAVIEVAAEAERLPEEYEPVLIEEDRLRLLDLVEEELLLAIPQIPRHETGQCGIAIESVDPAASDQEADTRPANPFAVLASLKSDNQS